MLNYRLETAQDTLKKMLTDAVNSAVNSGELQAAELPDFAIERPADFKNGEFSSNLALCSAKAFRLAPAKIATVIKDKLTLPCNGFNRCEVAGPGFLNFYCDDSFFTDVLSETYNEDYGHTETGNGKRINVEFVSANPTGPMHLGNARGGALGDSLSALLKTAGYEVTKEFYINDAGNQIAKFAASLSARYLQIFNPNHPFPEDGYQGEDITERATEFAKEKGDILLNADEQTRGDVLVAYALPKNIEDIKSALGEYRIEYDNFFSEMTLHDSGAVEQTVKKMTDNGFAYEKDGAVFFAFSKCGGEKDEVLVRQNGVPTYLAADIAYHLNKLSERKFDTAIDLWGADHHGHVARLKAAITAAGGDGDRLDIVLFQFVRLISGGETVRMSKRSGKAITLTTLLQEVPVDAARFFFNMREAGTHLDFDLELAVQTNSENPVYYVQYAHARIANMVATLKKEGVLPAEKDELDAALLCSEPERRLLIQLAELPEVIDGAARSYDVSAIPKYLLTLAASFHKFYTDCRIKGEEEKLAKNRLALSVSTQKVMALLLKILAVDAPENM